MSLDQIRADEQSLGKLTKKELCVLIGEVASLDARLRTRLSELESDGENHSGKEGERLLTVEKAARIRSKRQSRATAGTWT